MQRSTIYKRLLTDDNLTLTSSRGSYGYGNSPQGFQGTEQLWRYSKQPIPSCGRKNHDTANSHSKSAKCYNCGHIASICSLLQLSASPSRTVTGPHLAAKQWKRALQWIPQHSWLCDHRGLHDLYFFVAPQLLLYASHEVWWWTFTPVSATLLSTQSEMHQSQSCCQLFCFSHVH